mmetsp:Transcript_79771/g.125894  ORF Transcript_79771/g.125894 Transcript_79771/m.125894 type:complete len:223 (+) Transcript_79771:770-1438(+)
MTRPVSSSLPWPGIASVPTRAGPGSRGPTPAAREAAPVPPHPIARSGARASPCCQPFEQPALLGPATVRVARGRWPQDRRPSATSPPPLLSPGPAGYDASKAARPQRRAVEPFPGGRPQRHCHDPVQNAPREPPPLGANVGWPTNTPKWPCGRTTPMPVRTSPSSPWNSVRWRSLSATAPPSFAWQAPDLRGMPWVDWRQHPAAIPATASLCPPRQAGLTLR